MAMTTLWSELPSELIALIAENLTPNMVDYIRFRSVCTSWRSCTISPTKIRHPPQMPWMLNSFDETKNALSFVNFADGTKYSFVLPADIRSVASSYDGWLLVADNRGPFTFSFFNPISNARVRLSPMSNLQFGDKIYLRSTYIDRVDLRNFLPDDIVVSGVAMTSRPDSKDGCTVVISLSNVPMLLSCQIEDDSNSWTIIDDTTDWETAIYYNDVIYFEEKFIALSTDHSVFTIFNSDLEKIIYIDIAMAEYDRGSSITWRLVESAGKLLLLQPSHDENNNNCTDDSKFSNTYSWKEVVVSTLVSKDETYYFVELGSLGDEVIFLGSQCRRISLPVAACGDFAKHDRIYLPVEYHFPNPSTKEIKGINCGVYSLKDGSVEEELSFPGNERWLTSTWHNPVFY